MARATAQQVGQMDAAQAEVQRLLQLAEERAWLVEMIPGWLRTSLQDTSLQRIREGRARFDAWADGYSDNGLRRAAIDGQTEAGRAYTPQEWMGYGRELGELMAAEAGEVLSRGLFNLYTPVGAVLAPVTKEAASVGVKTETKVKEVAQQVAAFVADPPEVPTKWKVAAAVALGVVVLGGAAWAASSLAPVLTLLGAAKKAED